MDIINYKCIFIPPLKLLIHNVIIPQFIQRDNKF